MGRHIDGLLALTSRQESESSSLSVRSSGNMKRLKLKAVQDTVTICNHSRSCNWFGQRLSMSWSRAAMVVSVVALWAVCGAGICMASSSMLQGVGVGVGVDSKLVETETGWQFGDEIEAFDNATTPAPAAAVKVSGDHIPLTNGDFETMNLTAGTNTTTMADATTSYIPNWTPAGAGVQILQSNVYKMSSYSPKSVYCIHLNNPVATGNGTQGMISTTLASPAATGKTYTVHFDTARMPDGPINVWPAMKVSAIEGGSISNFELKQPVFNATDAQAHITWTKQSFVYVGTGASTTIKFESFSEKFGPLIDNVEILSGKHELAAAPPSRRGLGGLPQRVLPLATAVALALHHLLLRSSTPLMPAS